jgi:hypothetical protein
VTEPRDDGKYNNHGLLHNASSSLTDIIVCRKRTIDRIVVGRIFNIGRSFNCKDERNQRKVLKIDFHYKLQRWSRYRSWQVLTPSLCWRVIKNEDARTVFSDSFIVRPSLLHLIEDLRLLKKRQEIIDDSKIYLCRQLLQCAQQTKESLATVH